VVNGTARVRVYGYVRVRAKFRGQMSGKANVLHCEMTKTARLSSWARASDRSRQRGVDDEHCAPSVPLSNGVASRRVASRAINQRRNRSRLPSPTRRSRVGFSCSASQTAAQRRSRSSAW